MGVNFPSVLAYRTEVWYRQLTSPLNALRMVLTITLERSAAAACLGEDTEAGTSFWPSSLYGILATQAVGSEQIWDRCSEQVEASLGDMGRQFQALPPATLSRLFREGCQVLNNLELAALLWALLRRREPISGVIAGRLGAELEVVAVRRQVAGTLEAIQLESSDDGIDEPVPLGQHFHRNPGASKPLEPTTFQRRH